jgi:hypothetical protein
LCTWFDIEQMGCGVVCPQTDLKLGKMLILL